MAVARLMKLLGDDCRLRLLLLLEQEELSVQELMEITGLGQSRVSRHLGLLREGGLLRVRREGTWTFYKLNAELPGNGFSAAIWQSVRASVAESAGPRGDQGRLEKVREARRERSRHAHDRLATSWTLVGEDLEKKTLRAEALAAVSARHLVVADLGCGAGFFTGYLASRVARVIAVDHSRAMLKEAKRNLPRGARVEFRAGELDHLPLADGEADAAVANLVLHHVPEFAPVASEMARILRPGGVAVITDLLPHSEEWMRDEMGDSRLGIDPEELMRVFREAPFAKVERLPVEDRYRLKSSGARIARLEMFMLRAERS